MRMTANLIAWSNFGTIIGKRFKNTKEIGRKEHIVSMPSDEGEFVLPTSLLIWLSPGCVLPVSSAQLNHPNQTTESSFSTTESS